MLEDARVVVVVPAFREEPRLSRVIDTMPTFVDDILVVDDASPDATRDVAQRCAERDPRVAVLSHSVNRGVGAAIVTGYRRALARGGGPRDAFAVMAGDGQMHPDDLERVVLPVLRGVADYVKGNRYRSAERASIPVMRRAGGEALSAMTSIAIGQKITDSQCGYTAIARAACERLDLGAIFPRFGYPNDLLGQLAERDLRIAEVPVRAIYADEESKLRAWHVPKIASLIARAGLRRARRVMLSRVDVP